MTAVDSPWRRAPGVGGRITACVLLGLALSAGGCSDETAPTGVTGDLEEGSIYRLEGSANWRSESVSWTNESFTTGRIPESEIGLVAVAQTQNAGNTHFFFTAPVNLSCNDSECFPGRSPGWVESNFFIEDLDWSPRGAQIVFQGRTRGSNSVNLYLLSVSGGEKDHVRNGRMPSFSRDGGRVVFVTEGKTGVGYFNSSGSGGAEWLDGYSGIEYPRLSPGDSLLAFSAQDGERGRRLFVWDTRQADFFPDAVTDPDGTQSLPSQDGTGDNFPTWSPNGRYIAYKTTLRDGVVKDAIYLTIPSMEPERNFELVDFEPGRVLTYLRWHPDGRRLLYIIDGDVFMYIVPQRYRDNDVTP